MAMRCHAAVVMATLLTKLSPATASTYELRWSTDVGSEEFPFPPTYGPDGPWQAIAVAVGNGTGNGSIANPFIRGTLMPLYPCGSSMTQVLTPSVGGNYSAQNSSTAVKVGSSNSNPDDWFASVFSNTSSWGFAVYDTVTLAQKITDQDPQKINTTLLPIDEWNATTPNGFFYTSQNRVGVLGLGGDDDENSMGHLRTNTQSIVQQMKDSGAVGSKSFGLHMGSVPLDQSGSLILGGYDSSRILGPVGIFPYQGGLPTTTLLDVGLGVEEGGSPFISAFTGSLYKGNDGSEVADQISSSLGAPKGSIMVVPSPAAPYIYLPFGTCEAVANYLPVTWSQQAALYTWNTDDPRYATIIGSPAYLEFTLADMNAKNLTIKVPFALLNLTLEPPLVAAPTPYFPCQPYNSSYGFWALGRSFLQAAFLGINYEQNLTFLAQAPGPSMDQSVTQTINPSDRNLTSSSTSSFQKSWAKSWKALPGSDVFNPAGSTTSESAPSSSSSSLTSGAKAGIAIGAIAAACIIALATLFLIKRKRRRQAQAPDQRQPMLQGQASDGTEHKGYYGPSDMSEPLPHDMDGPSDISRPLPHEMDGPHGVSDLSRPLPHEMDGGRRAREAQGSPVEVWGGEVSRGGGAGGGYGR